MEQFIILQFGLLFGLLVWFVKDFYPGVKLKSMSMRVKNFTYCLDIYTIIDRICFI